MNKKTQVFFRHYLFGLMMAAVFFICATYDSCSNVSLAEDNTQKAAAQTTASQAESSSEETQSPAPAPQSGKPADTTAPAAPQPAPDTSAEKAEASKPDESVPVEPGNVTVNFKGADIRTVLAYISEVSGVDIVPAPDVKGVVDLKLTNKPWKSALDIILRNYGFAYEREGDIIRVVTIDKLKQEELVTQSFNLNYSKAKDVVTAIKDIVSDRGKVMYDERTNTVLVTDIPTNIYKIGQIIIRLDKKTHQVLIEVRAIETVLEKNENLGIDWNMKFAVSGAKRPSTFPFSYWRTPFGKDDIGDFLPQVNIASPQTAVAGVGGTTSTTQAALFPNSESNGTFAFPFANREDFTFGSLDFSEFKAVLEFIKSRANTEIVSNPRIATLNNMEATINVGQTLNLPKYERNSSTGKMEIIGYDPKILGIILKVTPHVNDNNEIVVELAPEISDLLRYDTLDKASGIVAPVFASRLAKTQVMINDGDTIFIGGLIKEKDVDVKTKLPFIGDALGDIPYLGYLFTKKTTQKQKTELIFFITVNLISTDKEIKSIPKPNETYAPAYTAAGDKDRLMNKNKKSKAK